MSTELDQIDEISVPNHSMGEEERFESDFYHYLDTPENQSRYTVSVDALARLRPQGNLRVVDLGCGHANIANFVTDRMHYTGVDHSQAAIEECRRNYPSQTFVTGDALSYLDESEPADAIICCGFLFHNVDKDSLARNDDQALIRKCLSKLTDDGYLIIISPFAYSEAEGFQMLDQAAWKLGNIELVLSGCKVRRVWQSMALQIGAGDRARAQDCVPDWWVPADRGGNMNKYSGTHLGSWTFFIRPE